MALVSKPARSPPVNYGGKPKGGRIKYMIIEIKLKLGEIEGPSDYPYCRRGYRGYCGSLLPKIREGPSERPSTPELRLARTGCNTTILYDNYPFDPRLRTAWGFSCLVAVESSTILFDTGGNGALLMENMEALGVDAETIDVVVISHIHMDHRGGLPPFLAVNPDVEVYIPASFESNVKDNIKRRAAEVFEVVNPVQICEGVATTGLLGSGVREQSLLVNTHEGLVVVTGCAHPGIVEITKKAKEVTGEDVHLVIGGFHLAGRGAGSINGTIAGLKGLGVEGAAPCHCSGDLARKLFEEAYGDDYIEVGVGAKLQFR
jgi:7,8-dihydropterin-6-yl-methyl-4-(beta-D-ribofuranosyl)aminobenzene 5'-phosphate synthase